MFCENASDIASAQHASLEVKGNNMTTTRRDFLATAGAAGGLTALQGHSSSASAHQSEGRDDLFTTFDEDWQRQVDAGFYDPRTHMFLDDHHIDKLEGLQRKMHTPQRVGDQAVIKVEKPWEGVAMAGLRNSVAYDEKEKLFKFWYRCYSKEHYGAGVSSSRWAYATSPDGVHWDRPNLGLVDFQGSKDNNLVHISPTLDTGALLINVVIDDRDPDPRRRYKAIGMDAHPLQEGEIHVPYLDKTGSRCTGGLFVAYSPDGVRWTMRRGWLMGMICRDGAVLHGFDKRTNKWLLWQRPSFRFGKRILGVCYSEDFERWTPPEMGLVNDEHDIDGFQFYELVSADSPDGGYIGLVGCSGWQGQGLYAGESMPQLVFARDPRVWTRVSREPFMYRGQAGEFDEGVVMPMRPITLGDETYIFYYAKNRGEHWGNPTTDGKSITTSSLGLAKMPRDRWVSLTPGSGEGTLVSSMICFADKQLRVNANAKGGSIRVELQDLSGKPAEGFTLAECDPITSDSFDQLVTWNGGKSDLTDLLGSAVQHPPDVARVLRLKFFLNNAELFSFLC